MNTIHWGRFAGVLGAAFVAGFAIAFGQSIHGAEGQVAANATAQDLLRAFNIAVGVGVLGGLKGAAVAMGAFFVPPHKTDTTEGAGQ